MQSVGAKRRPGPPVGRGLSGVVALLVFTSPLSAQQTVDVTLSDDTLGTVSEGFWGLHYDGPEHQTSDSISGGPITMPGAYASPACRELLHNLGMKSVRIFVWQARVHPDAEAWNWETTDEEIRQVVEAGFEPEGIDGGIDLGQGLHDAGGLLRIADGGFVFHGESFVPGGVPCLFDDPRRRPVTSPGAGVFFVGAASAASF